ncbi:uncharacterized protein LOC111015652 [Momordica charantia]|uniref:Uncharacterized protein LOC111015652 n=1 Tax=Momordica charantia TaxID=3673 RepID=A0A6J1CZC7_MOMCH|nr:uncharacterized protein LOC111015652 [Momordica charantia]
MSSDLHSLSSPLAFAVMDAATAAVAVAVDPCFSPELSTGYLEDALVEFTSKRRRLLLNDHIHNNNLVDQFQFPQSYWSSYCTWGADADNASDTFDWTNQIYDFNNYDAVSADELISTSPKSRISEETNYTDVSAMKTPEVEAFSTPNYNNYCYEHPNSSSSSSKHQFHAEFLADKQTILSLSRKLPLSSGGGSETKNLKKRKVVYPFALVKPGGVEGDITLNDINQKILMPPTRPVRHPVGDFACRPCVSADGPGLSGKAVVALTRIHTQGRRGSITIIRTKG